MNPFKLTYLALVVTMAALASAGCAHTRQPEPQSEREVHVISEDASGVGSQLEAGTGGAGADAYCNELQKQCYRACRRRKPEITSIPKGSGAHVEHCNAKCLNEFMLCVEKMEELEKQDSRKQEFRFSSLDAALAWLKEHKTEVAIGAVVVVGGVVAAPYVAAYVVATSATGALILVSTAL